MRLHYLAIGCLHQQTFATMQDTWLTQRRSGCTHTGMHSMSGRLHSYQLHEWLFQEMIKSTGCITAATYTGDHTTRQFGTGLLCQLFADLFTDHTLKARDHIRIRMWTY